MSSLGRDLDLIAADLHDGRFSDNAEVLALIDRQGSNSKQEQHPKAYICSVVHGAELRFALVPVCGFVGFWTFFDQKTMGRTRRQGLWLERLLRAEARDCLWSCWSRP
jgi:hypothetical protein